MNSIWLYDTSADYPTVLLDESVMRPRTDREAFVEITGGVAPIFARVWMTDIQFAALPTAFKQGSSTLGIKIQSLSNSRTAPTVDGNILRTLKYSRQFYLVSKTIDQAGPSGAVVEVLLATQQNWWVYKTTNRVYNVLTAGKTAYAAGATNASTPKTYQNVVDDLESDLGISPSTNLPSTYTAKPHNLALRRVPAGEAMARVLRPLGAQLVCSPFTNEANLVWSYVQLDGSDTADTTALTNLSTYNGDAGSCWYRDASAGNVAPATVDVAFPKWPNPTPSGPTDGTVERYTIVSKSNTATGSISGSKATIYVGDHFDASTKVYTETLSDIATERASCYFKRVNIPNEVWSFIGAYDFLPSATIRRVRVSLDIDGCFTVVSRHGLPDQPREAWQSRWQGAYSPARFPEFGDGVNATLTPRDDGVLDVLTESSPAVWITGSSGMGAGKYTGFLAALPTSPLDTSSTLTDANCGSASTTACYIFNSYEIGTGASHDLATSKAYPGATWIGTASDGLPVYLIYVVPSSC